MEITSIKTLLNLKGYKRANRAELKMLLNDKDNWKRGGCRWGQYLKAGKDDSYFVNILIVDNKPQIMLWKCGRVNPTEKLISIVLGIKQGDKVKDILTKQEV